MWHAVPSMKSPGKPEQVKLHAIPGYNLISSMYLSRFFDLKNYFLDFYWKQAGNVQAKIEWTLYLIRVTKQVPEKYFKHLEGTKGLYEIRVEDNPNYYRQRQQLAEHPFGTLKRQRGFIFTLIKGKEKVLGEVGLEFIGYNPDFRRDRL